MEVIKINNRESNIYNNLKNQIDRISKHNRQGSYQTKERYYQANLRFAKHLARCFGVENYGNIKDRHLESYVKEMMERDLSPSTIKTDLSGIRFFHDQNSKAKNILSDNSKFNLNKRSFGGIDRSWTNQEYKDFKQLCFQRKMDKIAHACTLARNEGLRIHEVLKIDRNNVEKAIKIDKLLVKGKGGKIREVPLSTESKEMLSNQIKEIERGQKIFLDEDEKTHLVIKQIQNFINRNREHFQTSSRTVDITFHGLRHSYAQESYQEALRGGLNACEARLHVSQLLGHERDDVTRIYLA